MQTARAPDPGAPDAGQEADDGQPPGDHTVLFDFGTAGADGGDGIYDFDDLAMAP